MLKCFSTLGCADLNLDAVLALARTHGLSSVELRALGGTVDLPAWFANHYRTPEALATYLAAAGVKVVALDTSLKLNGSTEAEWRETAEMFLPWAEALGEVNLRVFDGGKSNDEAAIAVMAERIAWWRALRQLNGWRSDIMIETHDSLFTAEANMALQAAAPGARILWDSHHTWKRGGEDPLVTWRALAPHIVHVHVKDSVSVPSARHPFTYVLPGEGEFPAAALMDELRRDFAGPVSLEWEKLWHPYLPPLADALAHATAGRWW
ncbi:MAG: TIM barrel protein [Opitutaceae bacterium]